MKFEDVARPGKCEVCSKETDVAVLCSGMGPISLAYCKDCAQKGLEPYGVMVAYISSAGHFPEAIGELYQKEVRRILKELGRTEEAFIKDVADSIDEMNAYFQSH